MLLKVLLLFYYCLGSWTASAADEKSPVSTVSELDLDRYLGKWHQIAAIPTRFQRNCARNTTAEYSKTDDGLIKVENSCEKEDGEKSEATGRARINPKLNSPSKLEVTFVSIFGHWFWTVGGNYWVMDLGERRGTYEYSVVGDPTRQYLWILARKPQLTLEELRPILKKIEAQYYDLSKIVITQAGELMGKNLSDLKPQL